ncbi:cytochrome protein [Xylaria nigripes]|nr:cytochrome protein [Xylaria nigripes]
MFDLKLYGGTSDVIALRLLKPWFIVGAALLLAAFLLRRIQLIFKLRHINGPLLNRISGIPHIRDLYSQNFPKRYQQYIHKYGQLVVVSPNVVITSNPDLWMRTNKYPGYTKVKWYYRAVRFDWRNDSVFTELDTEKHDARRKQMVRGYSGAENLTLAADVNSCVEKMIRLVRNNYARPNKVMDLAEKMQFLTLDVISTIGFGKCFGLLETDKDPNEYVDSIHVGLSNSHSQMVWGTWWLNWIPFFGPKPDPDVKKAKGFEKMAALNGAMVEAREKAFKEMKESNTPLPRADMLASFMKHGLSGSQLKAENILQIVAGSDTTSASLRGTFLYLMTNPSSYRSLQAEIDHAVATGLAPKAPELISLAQAKELKYLQACILEGMRMFSPVNSLVPRHTPPGGDTVLIDGEEVYLPGGINIIPAFRAMHRNKSVYGDTDVDLFRPERWIEETDMEKLKAMKQEVDLSFGYGRWQCLGKSIAKFEVLIVLFELFRHFDWSVVDPEKPWEISSLTGLHSIKNMWVKVEERKQSQL